MNRNDTREYALVRREDTTDGEWEECSFCGYPAPLVNANVAMTVRGLVGRDPPEWICRICANVVKSRHGEARQIQRTICNVANAILAALKVPGF